MLRLHRGVLLLDFHLRFDLLHLFLDLGDLLLTLFLGLLLLEFLPLLLLLGKHFLLLLFSILAAAALLFVEKFDLCLRLKCGEGLSGFVFFQILQLRFGLFVLSILLFKLFELIGVGLDVGDHLGQSLSLDHIILLLF